MHIPHALTLAWLLLLLLSCARKERERAVSRWCAARVPGLRWRRGRGHAAHAQLLRTERQLAVRRRLLLRSLRLLLHLLLLRALRSLQTKPVGLRRRLPRGLGAPGWRRCRQV